MRYHDLFDARAWKRYEGRDRRCRLVFLKSDRSEEAEIVEVPAQCGVVLTGKQKVHQGWFCSVVLSSGEMVAAENSHILREALRKLEERLNELGWSLDAIGLDPRWQETGLSSNTGYGYHPGVAGAVHMFEPRSSALLAGADD
jgi:hypothetical protein